MDVAEMKVLGQGKKSAGTNAGVAKGHALARVCIKYGEAKMAQEEKEAGKLKMIVKSIADLDHSAHVEFRAQLTAELTLLKELRSMTGVSRAQMAGYSFASFEVLVSNWKTISTAVELGYQPGDKAWSLVVAESVQLKHAHASKGHSTGTATIDGEEVVVDNELPIKRKVGRKATPLIDKAIKAAEELLTNNPEQFAEFAAWVAKHMPTTDKKQSTFQGTIPFNRGLCHAMLHETWTLLSAIKMFNRSGQNNIGSSFGCLIVNVANVATPDNGRRNQWRTPRLIKVFNTVSPEMRAKRDKRANSALLGMSQQAFKLFN